MVRALYSAVAVLLLSTGCVRGKPETQPVPVAATPEAPKEDTAKAKPVPPATAKAGPPASAAPPATAKAGPPASAAPPAKTAPAPVTKGTTAPVAKAPVAKAPATKAQPAPAPRTAAVAPLDLEALKTQLKQTKAIGLMTKLSLKNQVDDLLDKFKAHHSGKQTPTMTELRRSYDLLMMKVLSLLQDHDQKLASDIVSSRERIWGLLADPRAFAALQA
jgi:hypothetical protein